MRHVNLRGLQKTTSPESVADLAKISANGKEIPHKGNPPKETEGCHVLPGSTMGINNLGYTTEKMQNSSRKPEATAEASITHVQSPCDSLKNDCIVTSPTPINDLDVVISESEGVLNRTDISEVLNHHDFAQSDTQQSLA